MQSLTTFNIPHHITNSEQRKHKPAYLRNGINDRKPIYFNELHTIESKTEKAFSIFDAFLPVAYLVKKIQTVVLREYSANKYAISFST